MKNYIYKLFSLLLPVIVTLINNSKARVLICSSKA